MPFVLKGPTFLRIYLSINIVSAGRQLLRLTTPYCIYSKEKFPQQAPIQITDWVCWLKYTQTEESYVFFDKLPCMSINEEIPMLQPSKVRRLSRDITVIKRCSFINVRNAQLLLM